MKVLMLILAALLDVVPAGKAVLRQLQPRDSILIADQVEYGFQLDGVPAGTGSGSSKKESQQPAAFAALKAENK